MSTQAHQSATHARPQRSFSHSSSSSSNSNTSGIFYPPDYPPDVNPPPVYNSRPAANEDTLLAGAIPPPEGIYTKRTKHVVVALPGQEHTWEVGEDDNGDAKIPKYGKGAVIAGVVELKEGSGFRLSDVVKVSVQISGKMKLEIAEGGQTTQLFLDHLIVLHSPSPSSPSSSSTRTCPSMLPFSYTLPLTFSEEPPPIPPPPNPGIPVERQLPPTYHVHYEGIPGVRAEVKYGIKVSVERKRSFLGLKKVQIIRIPFNYVPRSRPHLPGPPPHASFVAALKHAPEEWAAFVNDVPRRTDPTNRE
ncbi:hypothetical protein FRB90_010428, partial [Tulasnella sp. 427]